jgi:F-type H+-transporting ATPase subunit epsilon
MAEKQTRLRVITPSRALIDEDVDMVIIHGAEGDFGVLPGHAPLTTTISYGPLRIFKTGQDGQDEIVLAVFGGFVEVAQESVTIMSDLAERPDEIDVKRAEAAKERAERRMRESENDVDQKRAELALRRALVRIEVSSYSILGGARHRMS